jgi:endonuclease
MEDFMSETKRPFVWQMIREAIQALGGKTTNVQLRDWILAKYAGTNTTTIQCTIIVCTVNHTSRIHYPENKKPRKATSQYDFLYRTDRGQVELYDPSKHGHWAIIERDDGSLAAAPDDPVGENVVAEATQGNIFAAEAHLRDYLAEHLEDLEPGLKLYFDADGNDGIEYVTDIGRIDILAQDSGGRLVVVELKVSDGPDAVCGQLLRYMGWVKRHVKNGKEVRGIIIAQRISDKIRYALADVAHVDLREYELALTLRSVPCLDAEIP